MLIRRGAVSWAPQATSAWRAVGSRPPVGARRVPEMVLESAIERGDVIEPAGERDVANAHVERGRV
jgi:hypothetical protein